MKKIGSQLKQTGILNSPLNNVNTFTFPTTKLKQEPLTVHTNDPSVLQNTLRQLRIVPATGQVPQVVLDAGPDAEAADGQVVLLGHALGHLGGELLTVQPPRDLGRGSGTPRHADDVDVFARRQGLERTGYSHVCWSY